MEERIIRKKTEMRRVRILKLSVFDCLTPEERALWNAQDKCNQKDEKKSLKKLFDDEIKTQSNNDFIRKVNDECIFKKDAEGNLTNEYRDGNTQVALFESEVIRLSEDFSDDFPLIKEVVFMKCRNQEILNQIIKRGVMIGEKKYDVYSSSPGQQKNETVTLLEEDFLKKNEHKLMCGLTLEKINEGNEKVKGINPGKYLAYRSLPFSSSVVPKNEINIDECIVVPDFETNVNSKVNFLDIHTLDIEEKYMDVPIPHMDGAGIFLPDTFKSSCQIRGGWLKGAMFPFDFVKFINKTGASPIIKDIYGQEHDVIAENIKVIFTGSQLKMWKYYTDWDEYKTCFKNAGLKICVNNYALNEPEGDPLVQLSYQFLQTIPRENLTDKKIEDLCKKSIDYINMAKTDPDTALEMMGCKKGRELDALQASIKIYPNLLNTPYIKSKLSSAINSERKKAQSGKVLVNGFYAYICPDLYAFCEWLFLHEDDPTGLIPANHVYNSLFNEKEITEVCCLRSPHLSDCEHGVRSLIKTDECKEWFNGHDLIISNHDLLVNTLQADVDGDKSLVTYDSTFIDLVDRNKSPLYYEMSKAENEQIDKDVIFKCLLRSFENSIIGIISNTMTKLYNRDSEPEIDLLRILCAHNNYTIDYPKTQQRLQSLYDKDIDEKINEIEEDELYPYFFKFAKDKKTAQCAKSNLSNINRICKYVTQATRDHKSNIFEKDCDVNENRFNANKFMSQKTKMDFKIRGSKIYSDLMKLVYKLKCQEREKRYDPETLLSKITNYRIAQFLEYDYFYFICRQEIINFFKNKECENMITIVDYLVDIEYFQECNVKSGKNILWKCFGDTIYENLQKNLRNEKIPFRRSVYQSENKKNELIAKLIEKEIEKAKEDKEISITQSEYDYIERKSCKFRKNCQDDRLLLFILLCLYKKCQKLSADGGNVKSEIPIRFTKYNKNPKKFKFNTIDNWIGHDITKKGLERLEQLDLIRVTNVQHGHNIYVNIPKQQDLDNKELFKVGYGNPLLYLFKYTGERSIKECSICEKEFIARGNQKTCSDRCSNIFEKKRA